MTQVRRAVEDDAEPIARIQLASWRKAYGGIMPASFLASLDEAARAERWRSRLGVASLPDSPTFVAVDAGSVVGFAHTGPLRDDDLTPGGRAEIYTIYVDPAAWRQGIGSRLLDAVDDFWRPRSVGELLLWVFEDNAPARAFYEARGWTADGARKLDEFDGVAAVELRYRRRLT